MNHWRNMDITYLVDRPCEIQVSAMCLLDVVLPIPLQPRPLAHDQCRVRAMGDVMLQRREGGAG